jgi:signal transduction histidine kinase
VLEELGPLIRDKGHRLAVAVREALPAALVDPTLMRQVVLNLLSNAIKFTPAGGAIDVTLSRSGAALLWAVRDTGIGIPPEGQGRLFETFYRAENAVTLETEGTGLGLYLVRLIVERLGGRVWCESEPGAGATFKLTIPLSQ